MCLITRSQRLKSELITYETVFNVIRYCFNHAIKYLRAMACLQITSTWNVYLIIVGMSPFSESLKQAHDYSFTVQFE